MQVPERDEGENNGEEDADLCCACEGTLNHCFLARIDSILFSISISLHRLRENKKTKSGEREREIVGL